MLVGVWAESVLAFRRAAPRDAPEPSNIEYPSAEHLRRGSSWDHGTAVHQATLLRAVRLDRARRARDGRESADVLTQSSGCVATNILRTYLESGLWHDIKGKVKCASGYTM